MQKSDIKKDLTLEWSLSSVIYQIYPRSFQDSNNDGIGDLQGIITRLDYLSSLGVNAIWLSPIYCSPQVDSGYDISDYCDIDPMFGTLTDFDEFIFESKKRGIRTIMDFVPNHTSDEHAWFKESSSSRDNDKHDWYIWADPKKDGSVPNNWLSVFGGSAWEFEPKRNQYYLHLFDKKQPDLNWRNKKVQEAMFNVLRFWMKRGVDGFRVDVPYHMFKDELLRDEPLNPNYIEGQHSHFDRLLHIYTAWLPETLEMLKRFADVLQEYDHKLMVTESWGTMSDLVKQYTAVGWRWYAPFNFSFITLPWRVDVHKTYIDAYDAALGDLYLPCYVLGNHDASRVASRIGREQARIAALLQLTLRGLPIIYYGDEIGMTNGNISPEQIRDTFEINSPGLGLGRDPERTPMQWDADENAGFSSHTPWLPVSDNYKTVNVSSEEKDARSLFSLYKKLITLKKHNPALREGKYIPLPQPAETIFAYIREKDGEKLLILANLTHRDTEISLAFPKATVICDTAFQLKEGEKIDLTKFVVTGNAGYILSVGIE